MTRRDNATRRAALTVGAMIRDARLARGWTQEVAAERAGVSAARWRQLEAGVIKIKGVERPQLSRPATYHAICLAVGLDEKLVLETVGRTSNGVAQRHLSSVDTTGGSEENPEVIDVIDLAAGQRTLPPAEGWPRGGDPLAVLVKERRRELGLSVRKAAARSQGLISGSAISAIENGTFAGIPSDRTVAALHLALGIPEADLNDAVRRIRETKKLVVRLPAQAASLSPAGWRALMAQLDLLVDMEQRSGEGR